MGTRLLVDPTWNTMCMLIQVNEKLLDDKYPPFIVYS